MSYRLTDHARIVLREREIHAEWLARTVDDPAWRERDARDRSLEHRLRRIPEFRNLVLRVVVNPTHDPITVVTAFFDARASRRLPP